jgi:O-antigen/teichoic acid export membrane protein
MPKDRETVGRRSARTFSALTLGRVVSLATALAALVIMARLLGPSQYGLYALAYAFFYLISATNNFGFGFYLTKRLSEHGDSKDSEGFSSALVSSYISVAAIGIALTLIGIAASGYAAALFHSSGATPLLFVLASLTVVFSMLYGTSDYALIGIGRNAIAVAMEIGENLVLIAASVILIGMGYGASGAVAGLLISYALAGVAGTLLVFWASSKLVRLRLRLPSRKEFADGFRFSLPMAAVNTLSSIIFGFGTLLLGVYVTTGVLGNYNIANSARNAIALFYTTAAVTFLPALSISMARGAKPGKRGGLGRVYEKVLLYSVVVTVPIIAYLGVFAKPLIYLLISSAFADAPLYLALMALGTVLGLVGIYATNLFAAMGRTTELLRYMLVSTCVQVAALLVLTPLWGALGSIVAVFFIGSLATDCLLLRGSRVRLGIGIRYGKLLRTFACNAVLALALAAGLLIGSLALELAYGLLAMVALYPILLALFGALGMDDIATLEKATKQLPSLGRAISPLLAYLRFMVYHLQ